MSEPRDSANGRYRWVPGVRAAWQLWTGNLFGRDLTLVLILKAVLILALYVFLFRSALHPPQDPAATAAAVAGAAMAPTHEVTP